MILDPQAKSVAVDAEWANASGAHVRGKLAHEQVHEVAVVFVEMLQPCGLHFPEGIGAGVQQFVHGDGFCPRCISDYSRGQAQAKEDRGVADVEEPRVGMFGCDVVGENACLVVGHGV